MRFSFISSSLPPPFCQENTWGSLNTFQLLEYLSQQPQPAKPAFQGLGCRAEES